MWTAKPALNIYTAPNSGFEFVFHTEDGKISAVISVARPARADIRTIAEKEGD
jgi:hypothetical protein